MEKLKLKGHSYAAFVLMAIFMVFSLGSFAQQKTIKGKVTDNTGATIPGASVVVKGTTIGTVTSIDGAYQLIVPASAEVLWFSYIGMKSQEVQIAGQTTINVVLEAEVINVDEVVVVGYGTRMKEELTGSVSTVSSTQLAVSNAPSVVSRLQGQVSGVTITQANTPGGQATIRIRGTGTINDPNPLYVIDGVPSGPSNNVNPNDIESISILKDASSAAIYGTRGANGVIIITTKKGKEGQKANINFTARTGVTEASNQYDLLNTKEYGEALWLQAKMQGKTPGVNFSHPQYGSGAQPVIPNYILPAGAATTDESLYKFPESVIFKANKQGTNWYDEIYRAGKIQDFNLAVTGGSDKVTYALTGNYLSEEGFLTHTKFERYTFRLGTDAKLNNWFKIGQSIQVSYIDQSGNMDDNGEGTVISFAYRMQPIIPVYDISGLHFAGSKAPAMGNASNPVALLYRAKDNIGKYFRGLGNIYAEITPYKGITLKSLLGYNIGQWNAKYLTLASYEASEPNRVDGVSVDSNYDLQWNWSNTANYAATFADVHKFNVVVGTEAINYDNHWMGAGRSQYFSTDPNYMQLDAGEINQTNYGNVSQWSLFSVFGRVNYDLMSKYLLEVTARRDGSSRFSQEHRYGTFPAASLAWVFSQENFLRSASSWLDLGKLRLGWGMSGNDRIGEYNVFSTYAANLYWAGYDINGSNTSEVTGFQPDRKGNPNVTWETTQTLNVGLDIKAFKNTLNLSLDVWDRRTSDMLYQLTIPYVSGTATAPYVNIGQMKNSGFDVELGYNNTAIAGKLKYNVNLTLSHYKNEILKLSEDVTEKIITGGLRQINYNRAQKGTAFPEFYGYKADGLFQTPADTVGYPKMTSFGDYNKPGHIRYKDISGPDGVPDGKIDPDNDMTFIGSPHPDLTGGLNIDLAYGAFDLNIFFYGSYGNDMINYVRRWIDLGQFNGGMSTDALYKSWGSPYLKNNKDATLPMIDQADGSQQPSTFWIEDGSYLRLKNVALGYSLPKGILSKIQVQNVRVYAQVSNLFTLTKYSGLDPALNSSGGYMGLDQGAWPTPRQIMFGLTIGL
jgi:TonB-dependent starch-binding outer membrane protein SusC